MGYDLSDFEKDNLPLQVEAIISMLKGSKSVVELSDVLANVAKFGRNGRNENEKIVEIFCLSAREHLDNIIKSVLDEADQKKEMEYNLRRLYTERIRALYLDYAERGEATEAGSDKLTASLIEEINKVISEFEVENNKKIEDVFGLSRNLYIDGAAKNSLPGEDYYMKYYQQEGYAWDIKNNYLEFVAKNQWKQESWPVLSEDFLDNIVVECYNLGSEMKAMKEMLPSNIENHYANYGILDDEDMVNILREIRNMIFKNKEEKLDEIGEKEINFIKKILWKEAEKIIKNRDISFLGR